jgi:phage terminase large subunit
LRANPDKFKAMLAYYRDGHTADFINDWGITFDPRNLARGIPAKIPFIIFPKQREWVDWVVNYLWKNNKDGLTDKSREIGVSWLACATLCTLAILNRGFVGGFGSRKLEYVDKFGDPKSLFWKAREYLDNLPVELRAGWTRGTDAHCRITFPITGSAITGEAGDHIGRGDRTSIHVVDEAAYLEHPDTIDAALSQTTRCRIDVSSAHGMNNPFARKRHSWPTEQIMTIHWRDDPRKDQAWYQEQCERLDPIVVAQEIDINYMASVEGILIPAAWIHAAIDADKKLGIEISGGIKCSLDIADEGPDKNAWTAARGVKVFRAEDWSGEASNLYRTLLKTFQLCDSVQCSDLVFDSDGMGVSVRGDSEVLNDSRELKIKTYPFHASGRVQYPEREDVPGRLNQDMYSNAKAQAWWRLRMRFEKTFKAVMTAKEDPYYSNSPDLLPRSSVSIPDPHTSLQPEWKINPDELIVIDGQMPSLTRFTQELVQVIYGYSMTGKLQIVKAEKGMASPNMADSLMMLFGTETEPPLRVLQTSEMVLTAGNGVLFPNRCDCVFGVIVANMRSGRDTDGAACVFCAHDANERHPLVVLDWDITEMNSRLLDDWMAGMFAKLEVFSTACKASMGSMGMWFKDDTTGLVFLNRADRLGFPAQMIESELDDLNRALTVSGAVRDGVVQLTQDSLEKTQNFKGVTRNHLTGQVGEFNPSMKDLDGKVVLNAFTHAIVLSKGNVEGY